MEGDGKRNHDHWKPPQSPSVGNKLTIILPMEITNYLDHLVLDIRAKTRRKIRRAEIIRAIIHGVIQSGIDLTGYANEEQISKVIQESITRPPIRKSIKDIMRDKMQTIYDDLVHENPDQEPEAWEYIKNQGAEGIVKRLK